MMRGFRNEDLCAGTGKPPYAVYTDYDLRDGVGNLGLGSCVACHRLIAFSRKGINRHRAEPQDYDERQGLLYEQTP